MVGKRVVGKRGYTREDDGDDDVDDDVDDDGDNLACGIGSIGAAQNS